jgi:FAD/FMN-containing dehydrogenase
MGPPLEKNGEQTTDGDTIVNLMKNIKLAFDPKNILKLGKICQ